MLRSRVQVAVEAYYFLLSRHHLSGPKKTSDNVAKARPKSLIARAEYPKDEEIPNRWIPRMNATILTYMPARSRRPRMTSSEPFRRTRDFAEIILAAKSGTNPIQLAES